ncbi:MAG: hypothetical protein NXI30_04600 [bacterium]|nr:hypothetical protein [bacterium]
MTDPKSAGDGGEVKRYCVRCEPGEVQADRLIENEYGPVVPYSALAEAEAEIADLREELEIERRLRVIPEDKNPYDKIARLRAALAEAKGEAKLLSGGLDVAVARAESAESEVARLRARVEELEGSVAHLRECADGSATRAEQWAARCDQRIAERDEVQKALARLWRMAPVGALPPDLRALVDAAVAAHPWNDERNP